MTSRANQTLTYDENNNDDKERIASNQNVTTSNTKLFWAMRNLETSYNAQPLKAIEKAIEKANKSKVRMDVKAFLLHSLSKLNVEADELKSHHEAWDHQHEIDREKLQAAIKEEIQDMNKRKYSGKNLTASYHKIDIVSKTNGCFKLKAMAFMEQDS